MFNILELIVRAITGRSVVWVFKKICDSFWIDTEPYRNKLRCEGGARFFDEDEWQAEQKATLLPTVERTEISGHRITSESANSRSIDFVPLQEVRQRLLDISYMHSGGGSIPT